MKKGFYLLLIALIVLSCKKKETVYDNISANEDKDSITATHPGKTLMETQCYLCHGPKDAENERVAPPMIAIKAHYIKDDTSKEAFTNAMLAFLEKPSEENAKLKGAVRKFGVMPYQPFNEEDIRKISAYIYDFEIEEPEWFESHFKKHKGKKGKGYKNLDRKRKRKGKKNHGDKSSSKHSKTYEEIGLNYALETKKVLGKNLMGTIQKEGTVEALKFCNVKAYPLTDSMANTFDAKIKRVSDKPRNPSNQANAKELEKIDFFKKAVANNEDITPVVEKHRGETYFYYPILTNSMCLQCHGKPSAVKPEVMASITDLYPNDMATGYDVNEVRGIWSIIFKSKQNE